MTTSGNDKIFRRAEIIWLLDCAATAKACEDYSIISVLEKGDREEILSYIVGAIREGDFSKIRSTARASAEKQTDSVLPLKQTIRTLAKKVAISEAYESLWSRRPKLSEPIGEDPEEVIIPQDHWEIILDIAYSLGNNFFVNDWYLLREALADLNAERICHLLAQKAEQCNKDTILEMLRDAEDKIDVNNQDAEEQLRNALRAISATADLAATIEKAIQRVSYEWILDQILETGEGNQIVEATEGGR